MEQKLPAESRQKQKRLVLCFDGTGNKFIGNESDTNIVKIYQMLERQNPDQFHYYQPGIGTYEQSSSSSSSSGNRLKRLRTWLLATTDMMTGRSFEYHVLAGYQFVMRYYSLNDAIYVFGFSRGAYTARFLAEMLSTIGLLSRGNEEMVRFAWHTFSDFQRARGQDQRREHYITQFKDTFCRADVNVHFLGLFDCVNSIGQFEIPFFRRSFKIMANPPAPHVRHAISIHERRLKFKPALFQQETIRGAGNDVKEVWFAGNHCDIGGGWGLEKTQRRLLSDIPLRWMIQEVLDLPEFENGVAWRTTDVQEIERQKTVEEDVVVVDDRHKPWLHKLHDQLAFGRGASPAAVIGWWTLEILPIFTRLELEQGEWVPRRLPPNMGARRDMPLDASIHPSVEQLWKAGVLRPGDLPQLGGAIASPRSVMLQRPEKKRWPKASSHDSSRSAIEC